MVSFIRCIPVTIWRLGSFKEDYRFSSGTQMVIIKAPALAVMRIKNANSKISALDNQIERKMGGPSTVFVSVGEGLPFTILLYNDTAVIRMS